MLDLNGWLMQYSWRSAESKANRSVQRAVRELQRIQSLPSQQGTKGIIQSTVEAAARSARAVGAAKKLADAEYLRGKDIVADSQLSELMQAIQSAQVCASQANETAHAAQVAQDENMIAVSVSQAHQAGQAALAWAAHAVKQVQAIKAQIDQRQRHTRALIKRRNRYLAQFGGVDPMEILESVKAGHYLSVPAGIVLHKNEIALFATSVTLAEDKTTRQRVGGSVGYSIPMGHGFRFRVSSYQGRTITQEQLTRIDQGELIVTTQRIVFNGARRSVVIPSDKILSTVVFRNGVDVRAENRQKREVFVCNNPRLLNTYVLLTCQLAS